MDKQKLFAALDAKISEPLDLTEFHERFLNEDGSPQVLNVWLNPPSSAIRERLKDLPDTEVRGFQRVGLHIGFTPEETTRLFEQDDLFGAWLIERVMEKVREYGDGRKKKSTLN